MKTNYTGERAIGDFARDLSSGRIARDITNMQKRDLISNTDKVEKALKIKETILAEVRKRAALYVEYDLPHTLHKVGYEWRAAFTVSQDGGGKYSLYNDHKMAAVFEAGDSSRGIPPAYIDKTFDFHNNRIVREHTDGLEDEAMGFVEQDPAEAAQMDLHDRIKAKERTFGIKIDRTKKGKWKRVKLEDI